MAEQNRTMIAVHLPRFIPICLWPSWKKTRGGAVFHVQDVFLQQVPFKSDSMNMYSVPSPGIPGCPPGLEYLTQVDVTRSSHTLHFVTWAVSAAFVYTHPLSPCTEDRGWLIKGEMLIIYHWPNFTLFLHYIKVRFKLIGENEEGVKLNWMLKT